MKNKVPKLRFKEFSDEWEETKIGKITSKVGSGKTPKGGSDVYTSEGVLFIRSQNVLNGTLKLEDAVYISEAENMKMKSSQIQEKDILLNITGASIGRSSVFNLKNTIANLNQHVCIIRSSLRIDSNFLQNQIVSSKIQNQIDSFQAGGNREGLNFQQVRDMKIIVPSLQEQEKIANFLASVDTKIEMLEKKKELLFDYKKGMMQKLFSQKIRFKDENRKDYPEWEEKKLGEILTIGNGKDYKHLNKGNIPVFGTGGYMTSVDNFLHDGETIFIGRKGTINKPFYYNGKFWTVDTLFYTHSFKNVYPKFIFNIFQKIDWLQHNEASGVPSLSKSTISKIKIYIPSLQEQEKIANFLSSIDKKIELVVVELEKNKEFKKGLLQQMFV